ncbi:MULTISPECIES: DUF4189 domain-containing protein [Mycobacterium]|uniref:DUF4189 domain-containing protein n=2 Tax=Mycobacterium TaxID=1763 RepID=A0A1X1VQ51_MYCGS|nr:MULTISPECIES: DUF4189 domain-containing protein [Mycobacterium]ETW23938.1 hypothetical protein MGAST_11250 [Mycobacterium gastri 'Wayne']KZS60736.1 hypothetical protein A4G28_24515 [Mycobacterium ostraviense]ORV71171.1 hypothetical protein AWC07_00410 [Mycobacterium gastri]UGT94086.1 DUF4189 domain-containing protein [Mycobacterium ostraviense]
MTTKVRRRIAFLAAGLGAALVVGILLLPPVDAVLNNGSMSEIMMSNIPEMPIPPTIHYGAIAYASSGASGKAWHQPTPARAAQVALEQCGDKSCEVFSSFKQCGAVAYNGSNYQGGAGLTRRAAEDDAMNRLGGGWVVNWACN